MIPKNVQMPNPNPKYKPPGTPTGGRGGHLMLPKKKKHIAFLLGCLWHYIKKLQAKEFSDGCDIMAEIAILLGINWGLIQEACRKYEEVIEFEEDT